MPQNNGDGVEIVVAVTGKSDTSTTIRRMCIFDPAKRAGHRRFAARCVVATPGATALLAEHNLDPNELLENHWSGNWGDCDSDDVELNEFAVTNGLRLMSVFRVAEWAAQAELNAQARAELPTIWAITEHDRSVCTLLLPEEY